MLSTHDSQQRSLRIVQLTDPHLYADPHGRLLGMVTRDSFLAVLQQALDADPRPDALVLTGDLVHDESAAGYDYLAGVLRDTGLPCACIAGNHDRADLLETHLGPLWAPPGSLRGFGGWDLLFADSSLPGSDAGHLSAAQLQHLGRQLASATAARPALLFLHHHPLPVDSQWLDTMVIDNGPELLALCDRHPRLKALVFGHIHQEVAAGDGCRLLGTPSTCVQFLPHSARFALDTRDPGYRELILWPDGRLETTVKRLSGYPDRPEPRAAGY